MVYLAGHNRPTHEVLFLNEKPREVVFESEFVGMTSAPVALGELVARYQPLIHELPRALIPRHRQFLLSLVCTEPEWQLLRHAHIAVLPALQWTLHNLAKLRKNAEKFGLQHDKLAARMARAQ